MGTFVQIGAPGPPRRTVKDPVCHMDVDPARAAAKHVYKDTTYHFCSPGCQARFQADPEKYLSPAQAPAPVASGAIYTCPMDPEVRQVGPGACPKCGMALEPLVVTQIEAPNPELLDMTRRFWVSAAFTAPILLLAMVEMLHPLSFLPPRTQTWIQLILATPVVLWGGWPFLPPLRGVHPEPQPQHVHPHRDGHRHGLRLQRPGGDLPGRAPGLLPRTSRPAGGVLRGGGRHRDPGPAGAGARVAGAQPDLERHPRAARAGASGGPPAGPGRRRTGRASGSGSAGGSLARASGGEGAGRRAAARGRQLRG